MWARLSETSLATLISIASSQVLIASSHDRTPDPENICSNQRLIFVDLKATNARIFITTARMTYNHTLLKFFFLFAFVTQSEVQQPVTTRQDSLIDIDIDLSDECERALSRRPSIHEMEVQSIVRGESLLKIVETDDES